MMFDKARARRGGAAAMISLVASFGAVAAAQGADAGCDAVPGTYMTTITDIEGVFASRSLITFTGEGTVIVSDSRQGGQPGVYEPFSAGQGAWTCAAGKADALDVKATVLTFTFPSARHGATFGRVDYAATLDPKMQRLSGTLSLRFTPESDLEYANPMQRPGPVFEEFGIEGERVALP